MNTEGDFPRSNLNGQIYTLDSKWKPTYNKPNKLKTQSSTSKETNGSFNSSNQLEDLKLPTLESLNPGSLVLGSVSLVTPSGLRIHIFNNIVGFAKYSELFDLNESKYDTSDSNLTSPFSVGSHVICYVLEIYHSCVSLSLKPSLINKNIRLDNLYPGLVLPSTVLSQEDHGLTVSFDINQKNSINGFVMYDEKSRESVKNDFMTKYPISSTAYVVVSSVNVERGLVKCVWPWLYKTPLDLHSPIVFDNLKPGLLLVAEVSDVHNLKSENSYKQPFGGYSVNCLGSLTAYVSSLHSLETYNTVEKSDGLLNYSDDYKELQDRVEARLIYVDFDRKKLYLSLQSQLLRWRGPSGLAHKNLKYSVLRCKIIRSLSSGLVLRLNYDKKEHPNTFFCNINDVLDDKSLKPSTILTSSKYSVGTVHDCKVMDFNYFTRLTRVALKPSLLNEKYVSPFEFSGSERVKARIIKLVNSGAIVKLSSVVFGKVPVEHLTDAALTKIPEKFQTGRNMTLRVLRFDHSRNRLVLTGKPSLVNDPSPLVRFEQLYVGKQLTGYIINTKEKNYTDENQNDRIIIKFYKDLQTNMSKDEVERASELGIDLKTDSVVKCTVTRVDNKKRLFSVTVDGSKMEKISVDDKSWKASSKRKRNLACKEAFKDHKSKKRCNTHEE